MEDVDTRSLRERATDHYHAFPIEIGLIILFLIFMFNYAIGRYVNANIADRWLKSITEVVKANFLLIGTDPIDEGIQFEDNSAHEFPLLLAKRKNMFFCNINLALEKRQDMTCQLFSVMCSRFTTFQKDALWIEIPITRKVPVKGEVLLVRLTHLKEAKKSQPHLDKLMTLMVPNTFE